ncbi:chemotaxis protein CheD [Caldinitratiruptor microaerophilus]|uniref:Probable chemoreceptor glutamine deamidase CheD n=1 Tax=Caldinitratiruptor microaerophilus TaxID=671077 RepID=A0AA35G5H4_9FIRM|nr:chemotaxis protein CheD [Caldinitratiruptor microaerophilus]BDG59416.1 putative chemoreceptor glutamine deamidase CheD [Caldinitratiruptor microaerophilus]
MTRITPLGLGEMAASRDPEEVLVCYGLGSCMGVALIDPVAGVGGMAHVVLPSSELARGPVQPGRFADTAIPALIDSILALGGSRGRLVAKIAGGARVLDAIAPGSRLDIGTRNVEAVRQVLAAARIPLTAEDTGGNYGRTVQLVVATGQVRVSTVGRGEKVL